MFKMTLKRGTEVVKTGTYKSVKSAQRAKGKFELEYGCYLSAELLDLTTNLPVRSFL